MFKRLLLIGALCFGMVALLAPEAKTLCRPLCFPYCGSFCVGTCLTGVKPDDTVVLNAVAIENLLVYCQNNGGNSFDPPVGLPFIGSGISIEFSNPVTSDDLLGVKGQACIGFESEPNFCFTGEEIFAAVEADLPTGDDPLNPCKENNWTYYPSADIASGYVYTETRLNFDKNNDGLWDFSSAQCLHCTKVLDENGQCAYECNDVSTSTCLTYIDYVEFLTHVPEYE